MKLEDIGLTNEQRAKVLIWFAQKICEAFPYACDGCKSYDPLSIEMFIDQMGDIYITAHSYVFGEGRHKAMNFDEIEDMLTEELKALAKEKEET